MLVGFTVRALRVVLCVAILGVVFGAPGAGGMDMAASAVGDFGYLDHTTSGAGTDPTGSKPESKLWWHDNFWWASLWEPVSKDFHIFRLDAATQTWSDTEVAIDTRAGTRADALAVGDKVYVASHAFSNTAAAGQPTNLYRYTYNTAADTYALDAGFPVAINNFRLETVVIDRTSDGTLWATWVQGASVYVSHSVGGNDRTWTTPFALPVAGASGIHTDDISSLIAFQDKIGVMWSNQVAETMYFAYHVNGAADSAWTRESALSGPLMADDHINLKVDSTGRVWAATKTGHTPTSLPTDPYIMLLDRDPATAAWRSNVVAVQDDRWTRPILALEEGNNNIRVFGASGEAGGTIYLKESPMDTISFPSGKGTPYIRDASSLTMNNASSTKQNLTDPTDLVVLAAEASLSHYWHNYTFLGPADVTPPSAPTNLSATVASWDRVNLAWTAATDDVGVVGYEIYRDGSLLATVGPTTSFADTTVAGGTTYMYQVKARDHVGNVSSLSNSATATPPVAPTVLKFSPEADARVEEGNPALNFGLAGLRTDGGSDPDVDSYLRFTVTGVSGTMRTVKLRLWASSGTLDGPAAYLSSNAWSETGITWNSRPPLTSGATDDKALITAGTWVEWDVTPLVTGDGTYTLALGTSSTDGLDLHSREGVNKPELVVTFDSGPPDTTPPTAPANLSATVVGWDRVDLDWTAATDDRVLMGYNIYRNGTLLTTAGTATTFSDTGTAGATTYVYEVRARDGAGNLSAPSNSENVTTPPAPSSLTFNPEADARVVAATPSGNFGSSSQLDTDANPAEESYLRFTVSGVTGPIQSAKLRLYPSSGTVDGPAVYTSSSDWSETAITWGTRPARSEPGTDDKGAISAGTWAVWDVKPLVTGNGTYTFVLAQSSTDGVSFHSREGTNKPELVITFDAGPPDTTPPTAPTNLTASAPTADNVTLDWTAATDNVGVVSYEITRDGNPLATIGPGTSYTDTTVAPNTTYTYQMRARDASANPSPLSNTATVTTPDAPLVLQFQPEADARVEEATPDGNFGADTVLRVDGAGDPDVESYLRFTVIGVTGTIESVKLRLWATNGTVDGPAVFTSANDWLEGGITWNLRPARIGAGTDDKAALAHPAWIEWDVTPLVTGNGTHTLVIATTARDGADFHSREAANKPELVVSYR